MTEDLERAAIDAAREQGEHVATVWCALCTEEKSLKRTPRRAGVVRRSSQGLVYESALDPTGVAALDDDAQKRDFFAHAHRAGLRPAFYEGTRSVFLLEKYGEQDEPVAICPKHGHARLTREQLLNAAWSRRGFGVRPSW